MKPFTTEDVAEALGVSRRRLYQLMDRAGLIPAKVRVSRRREVNAFSLEDVKKIQAIRRGKAGRPPKEKAA